MKERCVRYKQAKFMNKNLQKAIMNRSRMLNRYRKKKKTEPTNLYIKDREFLCETIKKDHIGFCNNLDVKCITENKTKTKKTRKIFVYR